MDDTIKSGINLKGISHKGEDNSENDKLGNDELVDIKSEGDNKTPEYIRNIFYQDTISRIEEWENVNFNRVLRKINRVTNSPILESLSWKDELEDITKRIIPGKTFNLWEESLEKEYLQRPKGRKLLPFLRNLENKKLQIIYKSMEETKELEIGDLDMIDFLDRDFLFLGYVKERSEVVERHPDECEWFCGSSTFSPETQVSSIHHMITVINNRIFYLEKIIWELDEYIQFTLNIDYSITVFDIPS